MKTASALETAVAPARMTWPCWRLVLLLMAICFLAHFNRVSIAVAADARIMSQYDITPTSMGMVYSAFLLAYTLFMIPGGWLIDRLGPRLALLIVGFGSAVFVVLTGFVGLTLGSAAAAFPAFLCIRFLMGIVSAPLHPAAAKAVAQDLPLLRRSGAVGMVTGAALLGVATTYVLFSYLIDWLDWPGAFMVAGLATALVAVVWGFSIDGAQDRQRTAATAQPHILPADNLLADRTPATNSIGSFLRNNKNLLLLTLSYAAVGYFQYLFFYWMHYYFETVLKLGSQESRFYAAIPPLAMAMGMPLGGWLSDRLLQRYGWRVARAGLAATAMLLSAALLIIGIRCTDPFWIVAWLSLALGILGTLEGPFWITAIEVGRRRSGLAAGIFNTGGNAGGIIAPIVTPWISDTLEFGWTIGIATGSVICVVGAMLWIWIDCGDTDASRPECEPPPLLVRVPHAPAIQG